jgi:hypothetical protein
VSFAESLKLRIEKVVNRQGSPTMIKQAKIISETLFNIHAVLIGKLKTQEA